MKNTSIAGVAGAIMPTACAPETPDVFDDGTPDELAHYSAALDASEVPGETAIELDDGVGVDLLWRFRLVLRLRTLRWQQGHLLRRP